MLKLLKNLKQSWASVIIIVLFLAIQATADLTLPDYTSKIVNIGIQQGGIESSSPEVITKSTMDNVLLFAESKEEILQNYTLISKQSLDGKEYEKYVKEYPILESKELYIRNSLNKEEITQLSSKMAKPLLIIQNLSSGEIAQEVKQSILNKFPQEVRGYYQHLTTLELLKEMTQTDRQNTQIENEQQNANNQLEQAMAQINQMPANIIEQSAIETIKEEYKQIGINVDEYQNKYILWAGLQMLGVAFISMATGITIMFLSSRVAARLGKNLREKIFKKVLGFSSYEFKQFSTASLITRSTNDIQQIQNLISMLFRVIVYAPIIGIGGFFKVLWASDNSMAWIIGVAIVSVLLIVLILFGIAMPKFKKLQDLIDKLNLVSREMLTGIPVIRAFHTEKKEEARFEKANKNLMKNYIFVNNSMNLMMPILMLVMNGISLLTIWVGAHNVDSGAMQVGDIMAFLQYTMQIVMAFLMISMISIMLPRAGVSAKRINEVLEKKNMIQDPKKPKHLDANQKGLVEFKNVSFRYPDADEDLLTDISFTAKPGETTAIIGSTGSGKSTAVNLIPRFYDVTSGEIKIDGVNIKEVSQKELRDIIGFVPQKGILFSGTIESNLKYGSEKISNEQMKLAAKIAQAEEFINQKENTYDFEIAQGGSNVSGGQRQRLAIARAIAKNPEIFVFDDSFSALDYKTDSKLRTALQEKTENKTVIIVAQRINTILNANQIIVLDDGKIVGKGTHEELMKSCEVYQQIALSQLSKDELDS